MSEHHYNLFEKSDLTAYDKYLYCFEDPDINSAVYLYWNKDKTFDCLRLDYRYIYGLQNEEQIWKVLDAYVNFPKDYDLPRDDFIAKMLRKNCKFYKETFGDLKLTIKGK
ncbi:MAG: hypothetical protein RL595_3450 [Planctomycetota bacterium]|jgi:hypothetical protein